MPALGPNAAAKPAATPPRRRKRARHLRVPVHPEEAALVEAQAAAAGLSIAAYMRNVCTGYQPRSVVDREQVREMLRINGNLGRLGGLLKLWLSDDEKLDAYPREQVLVAVRAALRRIEGSQQELCQAIRLVLRAG